MDKILRSIDWYAVMQELWGTGFAFYHLDPCLAEVQRTGLREFLKRRTERGDADQWAFTRLGEETDNPDVGLEKFDGSEVDPISGLPKDCKSRFHDDCTLRERVSQTSLRLSQEDHFFLEQTEYFREINNAFSYKQAATLDDLQGLHCANEVHLCQQHSTPFATTTQRGLYYSAQQVAGGAQAHIDRSFLSNHSGDQGGKLEAFIDGNWECISPPEGQAVVFLGVKALWVTHGEKQPLLHRSTTTVGEERTATVHFGQIRLCDYELRDSSIAAADYGRLFQERASAGEYHWQL